MLRSASHLLVSLWYPRFAEPVAVLFDPFRALQRTDRMSDARSLEADQRNGMPYDTSGPWGMPWLSVSVFHAGADAALHSSALHLTRFFLICCTIQSGAADISRSISMSCASFSWSVVCRTWDHAKQSNKVQNKKTRCPAHISMFSMQSVCACVCGRAKQSNKGHKKNSP